MSMGRGNTMVEFFSAEIVFRVLSRNKYNWLSWTVARLNSWTYLQITKLKCRWRIANNFRCLSESTWSFLFTFRCNNFRSCFSWCLSLNKFSVK
jgi:hypothetical protein